MRGSIVSTLFSKLPAVLSLTGLIVALAFPHLTLALADLGNYKQLGQSPCDIAEGNPINAGTGNKFQQETDYIGPGPFPVTLVRVFNSQITNDAYFGVGWRTTYENYRVSSANATSANVTRPDGKQYAFTLVGGTWTSDADVTGRLVRVASAAGATTGWTYTQTDGTVETYDEAGLLSSIRNRAGLTQTVTRTATTITVTDPFGRALVFSGLGGNNFTATVPDGEIFVYRRDAAGNLTSVTFPDGKVKQYLYENASFPHALTGIVDENGARYATWTYDSSGRAISSEHGQGVEKVALTFNADGSTTTVDARGTQRTHLFTSVLGVTKSAGMSQPPGAGCPAASSSSNYDINGNVIERVDFNGHLTTYNYDLNRNLETRRVEAAGTPEARTISTQWHLAFSLPTRRAEPGKITSWLYNGDSVSCGTNAQGLVPGVLCRKIEQATTDLNGAQGFSAPPAGAPRVWNYTYDASGQVLSADGPRSDVADVTTYEYYPPSASSGSRGNIASVTNALGHVTRIAAYDANGRPLTIIDPNGRTTTLAYDARGRLVSRNLGGEVTTYSYDGVGNLTAITVADGSSLAYAYDNAHRLIQIADNTGNKIAYTLDEMSNRVKDEVFDPQNNLATARARAYDPLNRLFQDIGGLNQVTEYAYDPIGNRTGVTDPLGHSTASAYDTLNRLVRITDPNGGVVGYGYDGMDRVTRVSDPRGLTTSYGFDGLGNLKQTASPDAGNSTNTYDLAGNLIARTDANGRLTTYSYDALNRVTQIRYSGVSPTSFAYDQGPNGIGRRTQMLDTTGSTAWTYDQQGRVTSKTQVTATRSLRVLYTYDAAGRLVSTTYPSGNVVQYTYALDKITQVSINGTAVMTGITYQPFGLVKGWSWAGGSTYTRTFDKDGRITSYPIGGRTRHVNYDAAGRITGYSDSDTTRNQSFAYDPLGRLTLFTGASSSTSESYSYDLVGNRIGFTSSASPNAAYTYSSSSNRLLSISGGPAPATYSYDPTGNIVADGTSHFTYDGRNRLVQASNRFGVTNYLINGLGQRVAKLSGSPPDLAGDANHDGALDATDLRLVGLMIRGSTPVDLAADCTHDGAITAADVTCVQAKIADMRMNPQRYAASGTTFAYDEAGHLIGEYPQAGGPVDETVYLGDMPVAVMTRGSTYRVYADHLGAPRAITDTTGNLVWSWEGSPFGATPANQNPTGASTPFVYNLRFPGQYYDNETGLHFNNFRDYNPVSGRYVQTDPIGLAGGAGIYTYAGGNPIGSRDPFGLWAGIDDLVFTGGGAVAGLVGQGFADLLSGQLSGWEDYAGAAVGGAAFGETLLYAGPVAAGPVGGAATNATKQGLKNLTGKQCGFNWTSFGADTAVGGATGLIPGLRVPGVTAGRGSWNAVYRQMSTKFANGQISNVSATTALKMFGGRAVDTAVIPGVATGSIAGVYAEPLIPGYGDVPPCECESR